jgi:hypothetical protein
MAGHVFFFSLPDSVLIFEFFKFRARPNFVGPAEKYLGAGPTITHLLKNNGYQVIYQEVYAICFSFF